MSILDIVLLGYVINVLGLILSIIYVVIGSTVTAVKKGPEEIAKRNLVLQRLSREIQELREGVSWQFKHDKDNYAIFFPFMQVMSVLKLLAGSLRFGIHDYLLYRMHIEVQRLENYWQNIEDRDEKS